VDGGGYSLAPTWDEYFARFNWLHETGVLWTKPSEPCFYPALGIPLLMSVPLGAHEGARSPAWYLGRSGDVDYADRDVRSTQGEGGVGGEEP
jgi:hypothetical protein